jgi:hypothetical protein
MQISVTLLCNKQTTQEPLLEILATLFKQHFHLDIMHYLNTRLIFFRSNDATGISQEVSIPQPYLDSVTDSLPLQNNLLAPPLVNLETSGLQQSPQIAAL